MGLISLGCAKNLVDAEIILGSLLQNGVEITNDASEADVVIVNTCSFIDSAQEESVDTILESAELREAKNRGQGLIVSGCLPQRFRGELPKLFPEVDAFMGIDEVARVTEIVHQAQQRRSERLAQPIDTKSRKAGVVKRFAELDLTTNGEGRAKAGTTNEGQSAGHNHDTILRGTTRFGKTKTAVTSPAAPLINVNPRPIYIPDFGTPRFRLTPKHFAYVKIAEGCNHPCSFCIIPRMRGSHRSRQQKDVVREARQLIGDGVKELNLISQDTTYYGLDLRPNRTGPISSPEKFEAAATGLATDGTTLCTLLRELNDIPGDFWIRLLYTHPAHWTDELIKTINECPKVARYVDMPLQHIHLNMLERMRRETTQDYIVDLVRRIREGISGIALRTTFIVGFPGETDRCFQTLIDFIRETKFERLGVFTYSREEGTRAGKMEGQVSDQVKRQRRECAMAAQHEVATAISQSYVGRTITVLVESEASAKELQQAKISSWEHGLIRAKEQSQNQLRGRYLVARGEADAPDIDGRVYVKGKLPMGEFASARIVGHTDYDLIAEPL